MSDTRAPQKPASDREALAAKLQNAYFYGHGLRSAMDGWLAVADAAIGAAQQPARHELSDKDKDALTVPKGAFGAAQQPAKRYVSDEESKGEYAKASLPAAQQPAEPLTFEHWLSISKHDPADEPLLRAGWNACHSYGVAALAHPPAADNRLREALAEKLLNFAIEVEEKPYDYVRLTVSETREIIAALATEQGDRG